MLNETLITLCGELYEQGLPKSHIEEKLGKNRETIHIWISGVEQYGLIEFLDRYRQAKKGERTKRKANPIVKRWIWEIREREYDCCGQKIQYFLNLEHAGIHYQDQAIRHRCVPYFKHHKTRKKPTLELKLTND